MVWVRTGLKDHLIPTPLPWAGAPQLAIECLNVKWFQTHSYQCTAFYPEQPIPSTAKSQQEYESTNGKRPIPTGLSEHNILINHCISISTWVVFRMVINKHVRIKPFFRQVTAFPQVLCYSKEKITYIFCSFLWVAGSPAFPLESPNTHHSQ